MSLTGKERDGLRDLGVNPNDFVALDVLLNLTPQIPIMGIDIPDPAGNPRRHVVMHFQLAIPEDNLVPASRVIGADGRQPSPVDGLLPMIKGRFILPRARVKPEVLRILAAKGNAVDDVPLPAFAPRASETSDG